MEPETLSTNPKYGKTSASNTGREKDAKKLRSRHAAQSRRILENTEFDSLAAVLPIPRAISSNLLDKASVVRLATSFLKLNRFCCHGHPPWEGHSFGYHYQMQTCQNFDVQLGTRILEALDGFLFCLSEDGTILYVSETVSIGLGLSQIEMIGNCIFDYVHYDDLEDWRSIISRNPALIYDSYNSMASSKLIARFKSSLVKRATKDTQEASLGFKVADFHISPRFSPCDSERLATDHGMVQVQSCVVSGYTGYAVPLLCSSMPEYRLDRDAFVVTTLLDFKIHYVDSRAEEILLGTKSIPVRGTSIYSFVHGNDLNTVATFHKEVLKLGASTSGFFRLMCTKGGCVWTQTIGVRINRIRARQSQCSIITMLCFAIGHDDFEESVLASHQLQFSSEEEQQHWPVSGYQEEQSAAMYTYQ